MDAPTIHFTSGSCDRTVLEYDKLVQLEKQEVIVSGVDVDTDVAP